MNTYTDGYNAWFAYVEYDENKSQAWRAGWLAADRECFTQKGC